MHINKFVAVLTGLIVIALAHDVLLQWQIAQLQTSGPRAGTVVTTINSTDRITDAPATLNANFLALNNGKIENSTTSLPKLTTLAGLTSAATLSTIGTISSGVWQGTTIAGGFGGTGTTSPTANLVFLGNGASGFKTVNGMGNNGQFLTSAGAGAAPTWTSSSLDTSQNFNWTGTNSFATSTTVAGSTGGLVPAGALMPYAGSTAPTGWLLADGSSLVRTAYPNLFTAIGTTYGSADGSHFTLPNLLGRTPVMASTTANIAQSGGEDLHTLTQAQLPSYSLVFPGSTANAASGGSGAYNNSGTTNIPSGGSGTPMNVRDPYLVMEYIIKY